MADGPLPTEGELNEALEQTFGSDQVFWLDHDDDCLLNFKGSTPFRKTCSCADVKRRRIEEAKRA
jgi:hypothetical protein